MIIPDKLKPGDTVCMLSPSGKIQSEYLDGAEARLREWGLNVYRSEHCAGENGRFSGTVAERLADLEEALFNPAVKALFCSRGGYGAVHLLSYLSESEILKHPKWIIGYSDITALHMVWNRAGVASLHAPMARHLTEEPAADAATQALERLLFEGSAAYDTRPHLLNRAGYAEGTVVGGNFSVLSGLRGTPYDFSWKETILFLEDIGERAYHIERMLYNLKLGGVLSRISGLIIGKFTDCPEDVLLGRTVYETVAEMVKEYRYPVLFDFPVGHVKDNVPLVVGRKASLEVNEKGGRLDFSAF